MERRKVLGTAAGLVGAIAAYFAAIPFVGSLLPSARARALAGPVQVDLSGLRPGEVRPFAYRGRTMLVLRRTPEMISRLNAMEDRLQDSSVVADPPYVASSSRSILPEFLVVEGICTHFGCVPLLKSAQEGQAAIGDWWQGGFICPCHNSGYDLAGRVVKGPAPSNLPIPPHRYVSPTRIVVGEESRPT